MTTTVDEPAAESPSAPEAIDQLLRLVDALMTAARQFESTSHRSVGALAGIASAISQSLATGSARKARKILIELRQSIDDAVAIGEAASPTLWPDPAELRAAFAHLLPPAE